MRITILLLCVLPAISLAQVPVTFTPGTKALASEVNDNFTDLDTRINENFDALSTRIDGSIGSIIISGVTTQDGSGVAAAECPIDRIGISANCDCSDENGSRNYGVSFACQVAGNGGVAGCFPEGTTFDPGLPNPLATVTVVCASATTNDGTPIDPTPVSKTQTDLTKSGDGTDTSAKLSAADELEAAVKSLSESVSDYSNRLRVNQ